MNNELKNKIITKLIFGGTVTLLLFLWARWTIDYNASSPCGFFCLPYEMLYFFPMISALLTLFLATQSIVEASVKNKKIKVEFYNPRDFTKDKWKRIDQKPYSGGPGMVIEALPVVKAIEKALAFVETRFKRQDSRIKKSKKSRILNHESKIKFVWFSPGGKQFTTDYAKNVAKKYTDIILISGRYEGIDARVKKIFKTDDISVGPYILTGGELPAMVFLDCVARQISGVLGNFTSLEESRLSSHNVYTRPEIFEYRGKKYRVPKVLLSGDHKKIEAWKKSK